MNKHSVFDKLQPNEIMTELANVQRLSDRERKLREILKFVGNILLRLGLGWRCPRYTPLTMACPYGQGAANYVRQRSGITDNAW